MSIIYQPQGRAAEYATWAANLYRGCPHACAYCFGPACLRMSRYRFHRDAAPRKDILERLHKSAQAHAGENLLVHLCFTCDPYPVIPCSPDKHLTRKAIMILKDAGHNVQILTKGGIASTHDFDLLSDDEYATTLTLDNAGESRLWEPHAAEPAQRLAALRIAQVVGIKTWVSLEPVIFPEQSLRLLHRAIDAGVSAVKVGPLNYLDRLPKWLAHQVPDVDWPAFVDQVQHICRLADVECYLKEDLRARL